MKCRYTEAGYLLRTHRPDCIEAACEGCQPCERDDYGDPTHHCTARKTCAQHVGRGELTCARCVGRTRRHLRRIPDLAALMLYEALDVGVNSEAANLAGPAADPEEWSWRKVAARQGRSWHLSLVEDDDEHHPYLVLGRWDMMLREDYQQPTDDPVTIVGAAGYLDRMLTRFAQDPTQDFPLFASEIRACQRHLDYVLNNSESNGRGAPCPTCREKGALVRLERSFGHWCEDEDCEQIHYLDASGDKWVCPRNREHQWSESRYRNYLEERDTTDA